MAHRFVVGTLVAVLLAACSPASAPEAAPEAAPATPAAAATSAIDLQPIVYPLTDATLEGELGCTFRNAAGDMLLVSSGYVAATDPGTAVVRQGAVAQSLRSDTPDGYDGLVDGGTFSNANISAAVVPGAALPNQGEQVGHAATLTATIGADSRSYEGTWTCGP